MCLYNTFKTGKTSRYEEYSCWQYIAKRDDTKISVVPIENTDDPADIFGRSRLRFSISHIIVKKKNQRPKTSIYSLDLK